MKTLLLALVVGGLACVSGAFAAEEPKVTADATEITSSDLASVLGVQWWSYKLRWEQPVSSVSVRLCELRRQPDGSWQRTPFTGESSFSHESADVREVPVGVFITDAEANKYDFALRLGANFIRSNLTKRPDFSRTWRVSQPTSGRFVEGCLVLATEEKDPQVVTGDEKNIVRIIGLEVKAK